MKFLCMLSVFLRFFYALEMLTLLLKINETSEFHRRNFPRAHNFNRTNLPMADEVPLFTLVIKKRVLFFPSYNLPRLIRKILVSCRVYLNVTFGSGPELGSSARRDSAPGTAECSSCRWLWLTCLIDVTTFTQRAVFTSQTGRRRPSRKVGGQCEWWRRW